MSLILFLFTLCLLFLPQVFTAILKNAESDVITQEVSTWVQKGLLRTEDLLKLNVNHLWLPACVKLTPKVFQNILQETESSLNQCTKVADRDAVLYAMTSLLKCARIHDVKQPFRASLMMEVLYHPDDALRLDGLALVCVSPKKSEPINFLETKLLEMTLPVNMNNDSAPFRQQLQTHLRSLLVRGRDSVLAALKGNVFRPQRFSEQNALLSHHAVLVLVVVVAVDARQTPLSYPSAKLEAWQLPDRPAPLLSQLPSAAKLVRPHGFMYMWSLSLSKGTSPTPDPPTLT